MVFVVKPFWPEVVFSSWTTVTLDAMDSLSTALALPAKPARAPARLTGAWKDILTRVSWPEVIDDYI